MNFLAVLTNLLGVEIVIDCFIFEIMVFQQFPPIFWKLQTALDSRCQKNKFSCSSHQSWGMARHHASSPEADWGGLGCGLRRTQDVFFFKVSLPRRPAQDVLGRPRIDWGFSWEARSARGSLSLDDPLRTS